MDGSQPKKFNNEFWNGQLPSIKFKIGRSKYSPTKASICFLIKGINSTEVGCPIP